MVTGGPSETTDPFQRAKGTMGSESRASTGVVSVNEPALLVPSAEAARRAHPSGAAGTRPVLRGWLHAGAFVTTVVASPFLLARAPDGGAAAALTVYAVSIVALFGVSASFHLLRWSVPARRRMRRADHTTIFVAIAGTYTAVAGLALSGLPRVLIMSLAWGGAAVGVAIRQLWLEAPKWAVALPYVVVGWSALAVSDPLFHRLEATGFVLLLMGGAFYTAGALVYARRRPDPWPGVFGYHEVFHACTVLGAILHFVVIAAFIV